MHRFIASMRRVLFGTRRRVVVTAVVAALALPGAALAAWIIYSGITGSATGGFGSATTQTALNITQDSPVPNITGPGDSENKPLTVHNLASVQIGVNSVTATFSSTPAECAGHLTMTDPGAGSGGLAGLFVPADGSDNSGHVVIHADSSIPTSCANGAYGVTFGGTTVGG